MKIPPSYARTEPPAPGNHPHQVRVSFRQVSVACCPARKAARAKFDGWLATAHEWIPAGHLAARNLAYPSPNWLPLSPRIVACALAQRQLMFNATQQKKTNYDTKC